MKRRTQRVESKPNANNNLGGKASSLTQMKKATKKDHHEAWKALM
jgi:hypothetical protein